MASTEDKSIKIMRDLGVNYVLVVFGGLIGYSGDDINKFLWMVRPVFVYIDYFLSLNCLVIWKILSLIIYKTHSNNFDMFFS